jgi:Putative metal-binding motif
MKKLLILAMSLSVIFCLGIYLPANAQLLEFPGSKILDSGTDPVGLGKAEPTTYVFTIYLNAGFDTENVVRDVVPAEFDVTGAVASCGTVVFEDMKGNMPNRLSTDVITWTLSGCDNATSQSLAITTVTDQNPGHGKKGIPFFEPTSCGPLYLNDGAVMIDMETGDAVTDPSNSLMVATCEDESNTETCVDTDEDGWSLDCNDCNDEDPAVNPGAEEICNGIDDNCNGTIDEGFDTDADGFTTCGGDCNDGDATVNPGATEVCGDGIDNNCDGQIDEGCVVV